MAGATSSTCGAFTSDTAASPGAASSIGGASFAVIVHIPTGDSVRVCQILQPPCSFVSESGGCVYSFAICNH